MFLIGDQLLLTNTTIYSTRQQASMVNSQELITCLTSTQAMVKMQSTVWEHPYLSTFLAFTIMTISAISVLPMPKENQITFPLALNHDFLSLANGKQTGTKVIRCQLSTIYFRAKTSQWSTH